MYQARSQLAAIAGDLAKLLVHEREPTRAQAASRALASLADAITSIANGELRKAAPTDFSFTSARKLVDSSCEQLGSLDNKYIELYRRIIIVVERGLCVAVQVEGG